MHLYLGCEWIEEYLSVPSEAQQSMQAEIRFKKEKKKDLEIGSEWLQ